MIAHRKQFGKFQSREAARNGGKRSQQVQAEKRMSQPLGPRPTPTGTLLKTVVIYDHQSGDCNRYDIYKSRGGKRRIDLHHNRERWMLFKSATWFCRRFLSHLVMRAEITED